MAMGTPMAMAIDGDALRLGLLLAICAAVSLGGDGDEGGRRLRMRQGVGDWRLET
jgi:hypothetical protein